jgi:RimJ/RimL family protein N-acetyltransferase
MLEKNLTFEVPLFLREVNQEDCRFIYDLRNNPVARRASRNTGEISYDEHKNWFSSALKDSTKKIYIAVTLAERIGQIRFDKQGEEAEVSITVDPNKFGKGYGSRILALGDRRYFDEEKEIIALCAEIRKDNPSSLRIFEKEGYCLVETKGDWLRFLLKRS